VAPVLHVNFRLDPKGKDQVRASVTRSFKLPDLGALLGRYIVNTTYERDQSNTPIAADRAGNPNLRPELATGFDLAYEHYPASGGVLSIGLFHRRIENLIRQSITLQQQDWLALPRWVARPVNIGVAHSTGLEVEIKGRAEEWLPRWFEPDSGVQLRSAWNLYRSEVEQVDGPDNRLEAQPPWSANMGVDVRVKNTGWTLGASLVLQPAYTTQQTDRQVARRSALRTLDAFAAWKIDRAAQLRIGVTNLLAPDAETSNAVEDIDGFAARSATRRNSLRSINASLVVRF
jgi:iron complex outermembrane receptor protein